MTSLSQEILSSAMRRCIELAIESAGQGDYPIGAVVLNFDGKIISEASSSLIKGHDPSAHPEVVAMRLAAEIVQSRYLKDCWLISSMEPCPMCASMAVWAKMRGIAFGTSLAEVVAFGKSLHHPLFSFRQINIKCADVLRHGEPKLALIEGLMRTEANALLKEFGKRVS